MELWLSLLLAAPGPSLASDAPADTDVVLRIEVGALWPEVQQSWADVSSVIAAWPTLQLVSKTIVLRLQQAVEQLRETTGADVTYKDSSVTLLIDADARGGPVVAALVRGANLPAQASSGDDAAEDQEQSYAMLDRDIAWARVGDVLVLGNERGVQRQLQHLAEPPKIPQDVLHTEAERLRKHGPVLAAFALAAPLRQKLALLLGRVAAPFVAAVQSGSLLVQGSVVHLRLASKSKKEREIAQHSTEGLLALWRGALTMIRGASELGLAAYQSGLPPPQLPKKLSQDQLAGLATWLAHAGVEWKIYARQGNVTEAEIEVGDYRGALLTVAAWLGVSMPTASGHAPKQQVQRSHP